MAPLRLGQDGGGDVQCGPDVEAGAAVLVDVAEELAALGDGPGGGEGAKVVFLATEGLEMGGDGELVGRAEDTVKMGGGGRFAGRHCGFLLENKNAIGVGKGACQRSPRQRLPVLERPLPTPIASKSG